MKKWRHYWLRFKRNFLSYPIAYGGKYCIRFILWTCRIKVEGLEPFIQMASDKSCILMLWHNRLSIISEILNSHAPQFKYVAFISKSRDGEPLAHLANSYSAGRAIRVSHSAKHQALKLVIENLKTKKEVVLFTPDGPRGPVYKVKPGIALAASQTDAPIIPFSWSADRYWCLKTWDQFRLPKPFASIRVTFGPPFYLKPAAHSMSLEEMIGKLENSLQMDETS